MQAGLLGVAHIFRLEGEALAVLLNELGGYFRGNVGDSILALLVQSLDFLDLNLDVKCLERLQHR